MSVFELCTYMCPFEKDYIYLCLKRFILVCAENSINSLYFVRGIFDLDILKYKRIFYFLQVMIVFVLKDLCSILVK